MSVTQALLGFGVTFKVRTATGPDVFTTLGQQAKIKSPYGVSVDSIDATHEESDGGWKEFIAGLKDGGSIDLEIHYIGGGAAEALLFSLLGTTQVCRTVFPTGAKIDYSAFITDISPDTPIDGKMVAGVKLKITGAITPSQAAAPVNTLLPSIAGSDGTPTSGDTLTAVTGVWSNEPTAFTYQWKKDAVNIGGATAKTYLVVGGDATHAITVAVTASNSAGSATATSIAANVT
jgi:predicted secreted protein